MLDLALTTLLLLSAPPTEAAGGMPPAQAVPEAPPPSPSPAQAEYQDLTPPPGSPAELALWKAGVDATKEIWQSRAASAAMRNRVFQDDLGRRLQAAAAKGSHEASERAQKALKQLQQAEVRNYEIFKSPWPVDPYRACGYAHLYYDSAMRVATGPNRQAELSVASTDLKGCVDRAGVAVRRMNESNLELSRAIDVAEKALAGKGKGQHEEHEHEEKGEKPERK